MILVLLLITKLKEKKGLIYRHSSTNNATSTNNTGDIFRFNFGKTRPTFFAIMEDAIIKWHSAGLQTAFYCKLRQFLKQEDF